MLEEDKELSDYTMSKSIEAYTSTVYAYNGTHSFKISGKMFRNEVALIKLYKMHIVECKNLVIKLIHNTRLSSKELESSVVLKDLSHKIHLIPIKVSTLLENTSSSLNTLEWYQSIIEVPDTVESIKGIYLYLKPE